MLAMMPSVIIAAIWPGLILKSTLQSGQIVPRDDDGVIQSGSIQSGAVGNFDWIGPQSQSGWWQDVGTHQQVVVPAVVVSLELQNLWATCDATGEPDGGHDRFGSSVGEAHPFGVWNHLLNHLCHFEFDRGRGGKVRTAGCGFGDGFDDFGMGVAQGKCAERHHPVDVLVTVDVIDTRASAALHEDGVLAEGHWASGRGTAGLDQDSQRAFVSLP